MNPYDVLGVEPGVSDEELARVYKRLAKKYHPDLNPGDATAAERMGQINQAYDAIKAMRQRGENTTRPGYQPGAGPGGPFEPFAAGRTYYYSYRPRRSPIGVLIAVIVTIFIVRLLLSVLFGGFGGYYYVNPNYGMPPGYGYYQTVPFGD